jgi:hypothetical protein
VLQTGDEERPLEVAEVVVVVVVVVVVPVLDEDRSDQTRWRLTMNWLQWT